MVNSTSKLAKTPLVIPMLDCDLVLDSGDAGVTTAGEQKDKVNLDNLRPDSSAVKGASQQEHQQATDHFARPFRPCHSVEWTGVVPFTKLARSCELCDDQASSAISPTRTSTRNDVQSQRAHSTRCGRPEKLLLECEEQLASAEKVLHVTKPVAPVSSGAEVSHTMTKHPPPAATKQAHGLCERAAKSVRAVHPIFVLSVLCVGVAVVTTFAPPPVGVNTGRDGPECAARHISMSVCICPRITVCADTWSAVMFLVLARTSAYFDYPLYVALFLSKAHNLRAFLARSYISEYVDLKDLHGLHSLAGGIVAFEVFWHSFWHLLRWGLSGEIHLLWTHGTGVSGMIALAMTPLITVPMMFQQMRKCIAFEWRKMLHYLSVMWALALCWHAPTQHIGFIMGSALGVYLADYLYGVLTRITYVPTLRMRRLASAVEVVFENPNTSFENGGYIYICLPW